MAEDLESYKLRLEEVEKALLSNPHNAELKSLATELTELVQLIESAAEQQPQASSSKADSSKKAVTTNGQVRWGAGDDCMAKYSSDGNWYPARITSVGGAEENRVFSVIFKGYNNTEMLKASDLKPLPQSYLQNSSSSSGPSGVKRKNMSKEEADEVERRKKKNAKKLEVREVKAKEQKAKQDSWKKFTNKSAKKGIEIAGVTGRSIFKTPDNPLGKGEHRRSDVICTHCPLFLTSFLSSWRNKQWQRNDGERDATKEQICERRRRAELRFAPRNQMDRIPLIYSFSHLIGIAIHSSFL